MELNFLFSFARAYVLTLLVETGMLFLLLRKRYSVSLIVRNSFLANSITLPFVWFVFPLLPWHYPLPLALSEIFAWIGESVVYHTLFQRLGWLDACKLSLICNALSFLAGMVWLTAYS